MNKARTTIVDAEEYIQDNGNMRLTAKEIAQNIHVHPSDLYRFFIRMKGCTLKKHLDEYLKTELEQLLCNRVLTGISASRELGFSSEFAFYRWVKRVYGVPFTQLSAVIRKTD